MLLYDYCQPINTAVRLLSTYQYYCTTIVNLSILLYDYQPLNRVAQNLLEMSEVGVLLVGEMHPSKPGRPKDRLALIGRARARIEAVDFNALFQR